MNDDLAPEIAGLLHAVECPACRVVNAKGEECCMECGGHLPMRFSSVLMKHDEESRFFVAIDANLGEFSVVTGEGPRNSFRQNEIHGRTTSLREADRQAGSIIKKKMGEGYTVTYFSTGSPKEAREHPERERKPADNEDRGRVPAFDRPTLPT